MKKLNLLVCILLVGVAMVFVSCDSNRVYEKYIPIPGYKWDRKNIVRFEVNITDTLTPHNLYVNIRNSGKYGKANLWLFIESVSPKGDHLRDTLQCVLADETGRWLGSGLGDIFDSQHLFKSSVFFPHSGVYTFEYEHGMRDPLLSGIMDVGIRVERIEK